jgi:hypothetical protein
MPAIRVGQYVYLPGGEGAGNAGSLTSIERSTIQADGSLGAFSTYGRSLSKPRNRLGYAILANRMYLFGGYDSTINQFGRAVDACTIDANGELSSFAADATCSLAVGLENGTTIMTSTAAYNFGGYVNSGPATLGLDTIQQAQIE